MRQRSDVIAFIQPYVPTYRAPLFDRLEQELDKRGLGMEVWHAEPTGVALARGNSVRGSWSRSIPQHRISLGGRNLTFRPILKRARSVAAIVAGLASTNLETYQLAGTEDVKLMLWGHGRNFTAKNSGLDMRLEKWLTDRARHTFVYTEAGRHHLEGRGVPSERLTTVRNSTDVLGLRALRGSVSEAEVSRRLEALGMSGKRVGLFVGALDPSKRLPFLFEAVDALVSRMPDFHLLIAGTGPLDDYVKGEVASREHASWIGRIGMQDLAELSHKVEVLMMPGRVGLVAVDSLALGIPLATTDWPFHAPEVAYLDSQNSLRTEDDPSHFAEGVSKLLCDPGAISAMRARAWEDGNAFSVESTAAAFADGIVAGLSAERKVS